MSNPQILPTLPFQNLVTETHRLLGPVWGFPPYIIPQHLAPPSSRLQKEDVDFIMKKGALDIPEPDLIRQIFKAYASHIHPHIPFLDLNMFSNTIPDRIEGNQRIFHNEERLSYLLFQSVMFAGAMFIEVHYLYAAGYGSRRNALECLFQRAQVLYDMDSEDDEFAVIQSLLLMTYWHEGAENHKVGRHWMGICISLALKIGLHSDSVKYPNLRHGSQSRLWWSIFTRDRLIALGLQQPPLIKREIYSVVPMISMGDFDAIFAGPRIKDLTVGYKTYEKTLTTMFIKKIELCLCIPDDIFSSENQQDLSLPVTPESRISRLSLYLQNLDTWLQSIPDGISFRPAIFLTNKTEAILHLQCAWLKMLHLELYGTLNRQLRLLFNKNIAHQSLYLKNSECPILKSATETTEILQDLFHQHLIYYLPTISVGMVLRVIMIYIKEMCLGDSHVQFASLRRFLQCLSVLRQLGRMYESASFLLLALGSGRIDSIAPCSLEGALKRIDIESLRQFTFIHSNHPVSAILSIRDPYDVSIIFELRSWKDFQVAKK